MKVCLLISPAPRILELTDGILITEYHCIHWGKLHVSGRGSVLWLRYSTALAKLEY